MVKQQTFILMPGESTEYRRLLDTIASRNQLIPYKVTLAEYKSSRSDAQNRLMWLWHSEFAGQYGITREEAHFRFKHRHVLPIMLSSDDPKYDAVKSAWHAVDGSPEGKSAIVKLISTTDLNVSDMKEALDEYQYWVTSKGYTLTDPETLEERK